MNNIFFLLLLFLSTGMLYPQENRVVFLENDKLKVGVLPGTGGRIVWFGLKKKGNILKAEPALWNEPKTEKPALDEVEEYKTYHGNVVWPSPMSEWWTKQSIHPEKKVNRDRWPPDSYLIYGENQVVTQDKNSLAWQSPESPVSGIQVTQSAELEEEQLIFRVQFKNTTDSVIQWGIWFNTRLDGRARTFVKVSSEDDFYIKDEEKLINVIPWNYEDGFFTFLPQQLQNPSEKIYTKACINAKNNSIAAFAANQLIVIETPGIEKEYIHPDHRFVEIFNQVLPDAKEDLLELEFHTEYRAIEPGETIEAVQYWKAFAAKNFNTDAERIAFLRVNKNLK